MRREVGAAQRGARSQRPDLRTTQARHGTRLSAIRTSGFAVDRDVRYVGGCRSLARHAGPFPCGRKPPSLRSSPRVSLSRPISNQPTNATRDRFTRSSNVDEKLRAAWQQTRDLARKPRPHRVHARGSRSSRNRLTGISSGGLTADPGGDRDVWERALFGGAYQVPGVWACERPKYGGLNLMNHPNGACPGFGSCHRRLRLSPSLGLEYEAFCVRGPMRDHLWAPLTRPAAGSGMRPCQNVEHGRDTCGSRRDACAVSASPVDTQSELGFVRRPMVRWFDPHQLIDTAVRVLLSGMFSSYADNRELQAREPAEVLDRSGQPELWLDYVADLGDGWNSTYTVARLLADRRAHARPRRRDAPHRAGADPRHGRRRRCTRCRRPRSTRTGCSARTARRCRASPRKDGSRAVRHSGQPRLV